MKGKLSLVLWLVRGADSSFALSKASFPKSHKHRGVKDWLSLSHHANIWQMRGKVISPKFTFLGNSRVELSHLTFGGKECSTHN